MAAAQDEALAQLQIEAIKLRTAEITKDSFETVDGSFRLTQRNWIEAKLPKSRREFLDRAELLEAELERDLNSAGLTPDDAPKKDDVEGVGFGYAGVSVQQFAEFPD